MARYSRPKTIVVSVFLTLLVGVFVYDFAFVEPYVNAAHEIDDKSPAVAGNLLFQKVRHEPGFGGRVVADVVITIRTIDDLAFSGDAAFSVRTVNGETHWLLTANRKCIQDGSGLYSDPNTAYKAEVRFVCKDVDLTAALPSNEVWYPFDGYAAPLTLQGCINTRSACDLPSDPPGLRVRFTTIQAEPQLAHVVAAVTDVSDQSLVLRLGRRLFLRLVSVIFLVMVLIFSWFLMTAADPKDTMIKGLGVFGSLWALRSLLVPSSVTAFPTLVEFVILTLFCVVFFGVLVRASE